MKRRMKRGRDWHAWAWKHTGNDPLRGLFHYAEPHRPKVRGVEAPDDAKPSEKGKWVRVKFVEVKTK